MVPKFATSIALAVLLNLATSLTISAQAQTGSSANLRGPISSQKGGVSADSLGAESPLGAPATAPAAGPDASSPGSDPIPFVNPPAEPAGAAKMPLPEVDSSTGQHTEISIPLDLPAATQGLLLDTTNPNRKPPKPPEPLNAVISNVEMTTGPQEIIMGNFHGLQVHVANGTDRPLVFYGDAAIIRMGGANSKPITVRQMDNTVYPDPTLQGTVVAVVTAGVTIGALPAARDMIMQHGPILQRYGGDEKRRESEESRFGKRILWPGDSCDGIVYFQTNKSLRGGTIELPVCSLADVQDKTALTGASNIKGSSELVPVAEGEANAGPSLPATPPKQRKKE